MEQLLRASDPEDEFSVRGGGHPEPSAIIEYYSANPVDDYSAAAERLKSVQSSHRVILIISDGNSQVAANVQGQISAIANEAGAQIYAVSLTPLYSSRVSAKDEVSGAALLDAIAEDTGGRHYALASSTEVQNTVTRITVELRIHVFGWICSIQSRARRILPEATYRNSAATRHTPTQAPRPARIHCARSEARICSCTTGKFSLSLWDQNVRETALHTSKNSLTCVS